LLYGRNSPETIDPDEAAEVILENERVILTSRRVEERLPEIQEPPVGIVNLGDIARLETECRAAVDAEFAAAEEAEITEDLLPSGLSIDDVYAIGLANGECPVGRVGRGYGADELVVYLFNWITGTFGEPVRVAAQDIREVRHAVLMTEQEKAEQGYDATDTVFNMDPLAEFQRRWTSQRQGNDG
jgi:hypothetical protein